MLVYNKPMNTTFSLGTSTVPCGQRGEWTLEEFDISESEAKLNNMRCEWNRQRMFMVNPGRYKRLLHRRRGAVMSNTSMEINSNRQALREATGHVLINGLGMGMLLEAILQKPEVLSVRVVETDADVIALVGPHFASDPRVTIVQADAFDYKLARGERYDFVWHDIWDDITADNLEPMKRLVRKYARRATKQGVWSRDILRALGMR